MDMRSRRLALLLGVATLALAACGDSESTDGPTTSSPTATSVPPTSSPTTSPPTRAPDAGSDRGWLGGAPEWYGADASDTSAGPGAAGGRGELTVAAAESAGDVAAPPDEQPTGALRAGHVDDNADFAGYLDYLARVRELGIELRPFDPTGRIVVQVTGSDGLPVSGVQVVAAPTDTPAADTTAITLRTTADGTVRFHPALYGGGISERGYTFSVEGGPSVEAPAGGTAELVLEQPGGSPAPVPLDVLFLLDATGSMGDEIGRLKTQIDSVAERVAALEGTPDVRFGMTLYRDEGDTFVTATRDFTADVESFRNDLAAVVADGGGDYPEALEEGLAEALAAPSWRDPAATVQMVFLVADAPPQLGRQLPQTYDASLRDAIGRGIKIFPVASSESDDQAEAVFRQLAQGTGARFVFLSYGAGGAATGEHTDITATDYEELALDDLVVRLIAEELAALTGDGTVVPPVTVASTPATNPPGQ